MSDLNELRLLPEAEARIRVYIAVKMELRYLRWAPWRKHMTAEDVLKNYGVEKFADGIVGRLTGMGLLFRESNVRSQVSQPFVWPPPALRTRSLET